MTTPLQVFNGIKLMMCSGAIDDGDTVDLIYNMDFVDASNVLDRVEKESLFSNIYVYKYRSHGIRHKAGIITSSLLPHLYLHMVTRKKDNHCETLLKRNYDVIIASEQFSMVYALIQVNPYATTWCYEDGIGSYRPYYGDKYKKRARLFSFFHKPFPDRVKPDVLFVNHPNGCLYDVAKTINPLMRQGMSEDDFRERARRVFGYQKSHEYDDARLIWFLSAKRINEEGNRLERKVDAEIEKLLMTYKDKCVVRAHPREPVTDIRLRMVDNSSNWELICMDSIVDSHVLLGMMSTAQIMPKILYDKEPFVIVLMDLYKHKFWSENELNSIKALIEWIRALYRAPEKIIEVQSIEGLREVLDTIL